MIWYLHFTRPYFSEGAGSARLYQDLHFLKCGVVKLVAVVAILYLELLTPASLSAVCTVIQ